MKLDTTTTIYLLSLLICPEAIFSRPSPHKVHDAKVHQFQDDLTACKGRLNSLNPTWTPHQMRLCLRTAVHFDDSKVLNELLHSLEPMKITDRIEAERILPELVFTCSVDKHEDLLYDLLRYTNLTPELTKKCFGRAAGEGSLKAIKRLLEQIQEISTDARDTAVIGAWTSGHRNIVDFIFRSPRFKEDWSNQLVESIYWDMYPQDGMPVQSEYPDEASEDVAVLPEELKVEKVEAPDLSIDQFYLNEEAPNTLAEDSTGEYFTSESSKSADNEDFSEESIEEVKPAVEGETTVSAISVPSVQDDFSAVPMTPAVPEKAKVSFDINPLSWPEEEHWIDKYLREATKAEKPRTAEKPRKAEKPREAEKLETSWLGSLTRAVTEAYSSWIQPEKSLDSTYGPETVKVSDKTGNIEIETNRYYVVKE